MRNQLYLYHSTAVSRIPGITQRGLHPTECGYRDSIEEDLQTIAAENGISLSITRQNCVFCYPTLHAAIDLTLFDREEPDSSPPLGSREGVVVIEADGIRDELYVGDFDLFSDAIDLQYMEEPDQAVISDSYEDALRSYAESLAKLTTFDSFEQIHSDYHTPEILIENGVSDSRIVETVLVKRVLGTGYFSSYPALTSAE